MRFVHYYQPAVLAVSPAEHPGEEKIETITDFLEGTFHGISGGDRFLVQDHGKGSYAPVGGSKQAQAVGNGVEALLSR